MPSNFKFVNAQSISPRNLTPNPSPRVERGVQRLFYRSTLRGEVPLLHLFQQRLDPLGHVGIAFVGIGVGELGGGFGGDAPEQVN